MTTLDQAIEQGFIAAGQAPTITDRSRTAAPLSQTFLAELAAELPRAELAPSTYVPVRRPMVAPAASQEIAEPTFRGGPSYGHGAPAAKRPNCSVKQLELIRSLREERQVPASWDHCFADVESGKATYEQVRKLIDGLFGLAKKSAQPVAPQAEVPAGRYAIGEADATIFVVVDRPTEGRWAGYTFVNVQASDELYPIRNRETKATYLAEIAKDPQAATIRYGHELGVCGRCGRTLTDAASRAAGIGPVCAAKGF